MRNRAAGIPVRTLIVLLTSLVAAALLVACGGHAKPRAKGAGPLDAARFPVVLEADTRVVARADGSGATETRVEPPSPFRPLAATEEVASPDGRRSAFLRDGKVFFREAGTEPREIGSFPTSRKSPQYRWSTDSQDLSVRWDDGSQLSFSVRLSGWSPDGQRRLTSEPGGGGQEGPPSARMYVQRADGTDRTFVGERLVIGGDSPVDPPTWSPDGRSIAVLYAPGGGIRVLDASGGPPIDIPAVPIRFSWSPDGRFLALGDRSNILIADLTAPRLARVLTEGYWPRWSPTGDRIAFKRGLYPSHAYTIRPDGGGLSDLGPLGDEIHSDFTWSPDGQEVEFVRTAAQAQYLYAVNLRTGEKTRTPRALDANAGAGGGPIDLSPDARRLAFKRFRTDGDSAEAGWFVMDVASGEVRKVIDDPRASGGDIYWNPGGLRLAFSAGAAGVYVAEGDGSAPRRVSALAARLVAWSPDGQKLAIATDTEIAIVAAGGTERPITVAGAPGGSDYFGGIEWSPDRTRLLYTVTRQNAAGPNTAETFIAGLDGAPPRALGEMSGARWSPNGRAIVFVRPAAAESSELWLKDVNDGKERKLADLGLGRGGTPHWSPDGVRIAVVAGSGVYVVDVKDGAATLVATNIGNFGTTIAGWSPDSQLIYLVPYPQGI